MATLAASAAAYIIAIIVVRTDAPTVTLGHSIAKVLLWIGPIFLEMAAHVYVNRNMECKRRIEQNVSQSASSRPAFEERRDWLLVEANAIITRADTVFIILLGAGESAAMCE